MDILQIVTPWLAVIGSGLGFYNFIVHIRSGQARLKIICRKKTYPNVNWDGTADPKEDYDLMEIIVTNHSIFAQTITEVGFQTHDGQKLPLRVFFPHADDFVKLPKKLERGEFLVISYDPILKEEQGVEGISKCYVLNSLELEKKGNVNALKEYLRS